MKDKSDLLYDVRVIERYIREGVIRKEEYEDYIKKLPDVSSKGCPLIVDEESLKGSETVNRGEGE
ncbi:MAG TPA: hypothetical protein VNK81_05620 [Thermodesulfobacteriota bacterium]|jgi:hypothetical protein|nr:hypothetical protein [Thermodesulfobacteriota bacterium]